MRRRMCRPLYHLLHAAIMNSMKVMLCVFVMILFIKCSFADCFDTAASYQGIDANILRAISKKENIRCDGAINKNKNGSIDIGCMQINSVHFKELSAHGVSPYHLAEQDQCKNIYVGAWHYKLMIQKYGNTWTAVGAYHSETPNLRDQYAADVYRIWLQLK